MSQATTMRNFVPLSKIGQGSFSSVYKVQRNSDKGIYALKKVKIGLLGQRQRQNSINQVRILASIEHPNIVAYKEAFYEENLNVLCVVMEFADSGDLQKLINEKKQANTPISQSFIWKTAAQIVSGLNHLHSLKILHRDLKPANIFISKGVCKLGDLNVSKVNKGKLAYTQTGTPYYASPEVWRDQPYNEMSDIWSLGCILYELCCLRPPFMGQGVKQLYECVQKGRYPLIPVNYSKTLRTMIASCLRKQPSQRPSCQRLLEILQPETQMSVEPTKSQSKPELLKTIHVPQNFKGLKLPQPKYHLDKQNDLSKISEVEETPKQSKAVEHRSLQRPMSEMKKSSSEKENMSERSRKNSIPRTERASAKEIRSSKEIQPVLREKCHNICQSIKNVQPACMSIQIEKRYREMDRLILAFEEKYGKGANRRKKPAVLRMAPWWN